MNTTTVPAPAGKKHRALLIIAFIVAIVAGAVFVPAMAGNDECKNECGHCAEKYGDGTFLYWICYIFGGDCQNTCWVPTPNPGSPV
ncbi:MAG: hypothetical protein GYA23_01315 [Methanomicrobiales archaeon]|nr:hypothetical protein [Methanomicrobiales archaeon]